MNWLLLRGLGRVKEHWLDLPEALQMALRRNADSSSQVLCLDLPGFGTESNAKVPLSIAAHTDYLRERFFSSGPQNNFGLLGVSLGGMIALDWVARYPDDFKKLVVINSSARDVSSLFQRLSPFALYSAGRMAAAKEPEKREVQSLKLISNLKDKDPVIINAMVDIAKKHPMLRDKVWRQTTAAALFSCPSQIAIPTLIVSSLKDRMVDSRCSKMIAEKLSTNALPQAPITLKFHPTAGHDLPLDDPEWLIERLKEFESTTIEPKP